MRLKQSLKTEKKRGTTSAMPGLLDWRFSIWTLFWPRSIQNAFMFKRSLFSPDRIPPPEGKETLP